MGLLNYNRRCKVSLSEKIPGYLGEDEVVTHEKLIPCCKTDLSYSEQIALFGKYNSVAYKLHLRGSWENISEIEYEGIKRNIFTIKRHKNSTVVIVS